ncbi:hypothetical protein CRUP_036622 [Coryphaenoides rupestris]|nr:hypothetical protein CRUP_036622 [Coryphaenoides rupestris]
MKHPAETPEIRAPSRDSGDQSTQQRVKRSEHPEETPAEIRAPSRNRPQTQRRETEIINTPHSHTERSQSNQPAKEGEKKKMRMRVRMGPTPPLACPWLLLLLLGLHNVADEVVAEVAGAGDGAGGAGAMPSAFQLAPDTPAPAEPTPTPQATRSLDPCEGRPCLNGGLCLALHAEGRPEGTWEYGCTCTARFTGRNCEPLNPQVTPLDRRPDDEATAP